MEALSEQKLYRDTERKKKNTKSNDPAHYLEAATNALKLYEGGLGLKLKPPGTNFRVTWPALRRTALTEHADFNGIFSFETPFGCNVV